MLLPTHNLTIDLAAPTADSPLAGAKVVALLDRVEVDDSGYVVQREIQATTDNTGRAVMALWPNTRGSGDSEYVVFAVDANGKSLFEVFAKMPDADARLSDIAGPPISTAITPNDELINQIQALQEKASQAATDSQSAADQASQDAQTASEALASATDLADQADNAVQNANNAISTVNDAADTAASQADQATTARQAAQAAVQDAESARDSALVARDQAKNLFTSASFSYMPLPPATGGPYVANAAGEWVLLSDYATSGDGTTPGGGTGGDPVPTPDPQVSIANVSTFNTTPTLTGLVNRDDAVIDIALSGAPDLRVTITDQTTTDATPVITGSVNNPDAAIFFNVG